MAPACPHCDEPLLDGERNRDDTQGRGWHFECLMRLVIGSAMHILGPLPCDLTCADAPELTKRQAARAAVDAMRVVRGMAPLDWSRLNPWEWEHTQN